LHCVAVCCSASQCIAVPETYPRHIIDMHMRYGAPINCAAVRPTCSWFQSTIQKVFHEMRPWLKCGVIIYTHMSSAYITWVMPTSSISGCWCAWVSVHCHVLYKGLWWWFDFFATFLKYTKVSRLQCKKASPEPFAPFQKIVFRQMSAWPSSWPVLVL